MEDFSNIKDVLAGVQFKTVNPAISSVIKDWDNIVGKKFAGKTFVGEIYNKTNKFFMLINVASSPLVQELSFFKQNIIKKIKTQYNLEIADLIIKVATKSNENKDFLKQNIVQEVFDERPNDEELSLIKLDENTVNEITTSVNKQHNLDNNQKERMISVIIKDLKTQEWMKQKGFPVCKICGRIMTRKNFGEENICKFCKNQN